MEKNWLNIQEAAEYIGLKKSTMYKKTMKGDVPFYKIGGRILFSPSELDSFVMMHRVIENEFNGVRPE